MTHDSGIIGNGDDSLALLGAQYLKQALHRRESFAIVLGLHGGRNLSQTLTMREKRGDRRVSMHDEASLRRLPAVKSPIR